MMIDKDALLSDIERTIEESGCVNHEGEIMDCVRYAPTADVGPVVYGEWVDHGGFVTCSVCGEEQYGHDNRRNYCPNCGARMWA